jgi:hypothetical protein
MRAIEIRHLSANERRIPLPISHRGWPFLSNNRIVLADLPITRKTNAGGVYNRRWSGTNRQTTKAAESGWLDNAEFQPRRAVAKRRKRRWAGSNS